MEIKVYPRTVDSHTHIMEMRKKELNVKEILKECFDKGMAAALDVAVNEEDFEKRISYKSFFPKLFFSAGIHPTDVTDIEKQLKAIENQLQNKLVIAVGETGLDFYRDSVSSLLQKEMFRRQIELSNKYKLPLIIHNRLADKEILEILNSENAESGGIIHCFSSDSGFAKKIVDLGFYISFAGNVTYKNAQNIRGAASCVPFDRILVETDAPYLAPQKVRGKLNHPGNISYTIECIADIFNKEGDEIAFQTCENFKKLFKLDI